MNDERSRMAVEVSISFGNGIATRKELEAATASAYAAYAAYSNNAAYAFGSITAQIEHQLLTANIVRKYLPISIFNIDETA